MPEFDWDHEVTPSHIENFLAVHGKKGVRTLSLLGKIGRLREALETPIGQALLKEIMTKMEVRLQKIATMEASDEDIIEYRVLNDLFVSYADQIARYYKLADKIKMEGEK